MKFPKMTAIAMAASLASLGSIAAEQAIKLNDITTPFAPSRLLAGDREFDGHGPEISSSVTLRIDGDQKTIMTDVYFHARENQWDWSETEGNWSFPVWQACAEQTITAIRSDTYSEVNFTSDAAGPELGIPGGDMREIINTLSSILNYSGILTGPQAAMVEAFRGGVATVFMNNKVYLVPPAGGLGPVEIFAIVGDTGDDDISDDNNPKEDTRIDGITFKPVLVELAGPACGSGGTSSSGSTDPAGVSSAPLILPVPIPWHSVGKAPLLPKGPSRIKAPGQAGVPTAPAQPSGIAVRRPEGKGEMHEPLKPQRSQPIVVTRPKPAERDSTKPAPLLEEKRPIVVSPPKRLERQNVQPSPRVEPRQSGAVSQPKPFDKNQAQPLLKPEQRGPIVVRPPQPVERGGMQLPHKPGPRQQEVGPQPEPPSRSHAQPLLRSEQSRPTVARPSQPVERESAQLLRKPESRQPVVVHRPKPTDKDSWPDGKMSGK